MTNADLTVHVQDEEGEFRPPPDNVAADNLVFAEQEKEIRELRILNRNSNIQSRYTLDVGVFMVMALYVHPLDVSHRILSYSIAAPSQTSFAVLIVATDSSSSSARCRALSSCSPLHLDGYLC